MARVYYTLAIRENGMWSPQFGDWSRAVVRQEEIDCYSDRYSANYAAKCDRDIVASDGTRDGVNAAIAVLNSTPEVAGYRKLLPHELAALRAFSAEMGRNWKARLSDVYWPNARVWVDAKFSSDHGCVLHGIRNDFGPRWLAAFRLPG